MRGPRIDPGGRTTRGGGFSRTVRYADLSPAGTINSSGYLAVWVGDDPSENDGKPLVDGDDSAGTNPGRGLLSLLVHAYGPSSRRIIEATVAQAGNGVRVLSWREVR